MSKKERVKQKPTLKQAMTPIVFMMVALVVGVGVLKLRAEPILILVAFLAGFIAWRLGYNWDEMQKGIVEKISMAMPAILILWTVGILIGSWMFSGTIPMFIYYGVQIINPKFLLATAFIITVIFSTITGTSWGSAGTIGVAIMGIAQGLGVSLPATAGAVVAGSYFGDKLSPLSDTTILAPIAAGSELYEHIKHMLYTTIPATIVSLIVYIVAGMGAAGSASTPESVTVLQAQLSNMFNWNILLLIPVIIVIAGSLLKLPTMPTMLGSSLISTFMGIVIQGFTLKNGFISLIKGFNVSMTGYEGEVASDILTLVNRGGAEAMAGTTILVFCAMGFAGIMSTSGMLDTVLEAILKRVKSTAGMVLSTIASCFTVAFVTGNSYLSILLPGQLFKDAYVMRNLHPKNLSRTLEDSGTVLVPLIPWSAAGAYMTATLGVPTIEYLPWAVFNYTGIVFAIILAFTGFGIEYTDASKNKKNNKETSQ
ncbi:Na+/H+ antiporter NhaC [Clostridium sp. Cult2]|uniref:Na+/H+ antiporter NhaC n=1 Tax=Clostridium sp. Cult2 TaxID=2079003 RepID=UPI001F01CAC9|nr:Na+/H+ antiporter NhaC [Clostridium sp. Cult2]MCF6465416.1 Na+/H+ antiporter NhaC [Clostridium sp. Cult2]